ncbi:hypothetical protein HOLleu_03851 [Holothuria leucospilota]|uniref:BRCT domain-containing protein n=1 Tax=Holothuria leucospilota TaxID=206669 RepID=A0A9Q1CTX0_HOLLE|nr:hypothetical protein HOLleu_03851 [Holothuria leucospilota]
MTMEPSFHLRNGLTCNVHQHGATCAIDVLLEVAYFGMFYFDKQIFQTERMGNLLSSLVNVFCKAREQTQTTICNMREDVWEWLIRYQSKAFCPKGTARAEALVGFLALSSELQNIGFRSLCPLHPILPILTLTTRSVEAAEGILEGCIKHEVAQVEAHWSKRCRACIGNETMIPEDFIIVELSVLEWKNRFLQPVTISETCSMFGDTYYLTAAVLVQPHHFLCIVKIGQQFARVDGLQHEVECYSSFTSALYRNDSLSSKQHVTSEKHDGIHLIVLTRLGSNDLIYANIPERFKSKPQQHKISGNSHGSETVRTKSASYEGVSGSSNVRFSFKASDTDDYRNISNESQQNEQNNIRTGYTKLPTTNLPKKMSTGKTPKPPNCDTINSAHSKVSHHFTSTPNGKPETLKSDHHTGNVKITGKTVNITIQGNVLYLSCKDLFPLIGMEKHIKNRGYKSIDRVLDEKGILKNDSFIFSGLKRKFIAYPAFLSILESKLGKETQHHGVKEELLHLSHQEIVNSFTIRQFLPEEDKDKLNSSMEVDKSPKVKTSKLYRRKHGKNKGGYSRKKAVLRKVMRNVCKKDFHGDVDKMIKTLGELFTPSKNGENEDFSGLFGQHNLEALLTSMKASKIRKKMLDKVILNAMAEDVKLSASELIHLEENYSGTRLFDKLRSKLPGLLPSGTEVRRQKKLFWKEFNSILLPERTPTGWKISLQRLIEVLYFRYYWLESPFKWRVYGDGREIGGRKGTFMAISTLNDEALLNGISYQNPLEIFPVAIFYEDDSRDNLEENLGFPDGHLNREIQAAQQQDHQFFLSGDEMFLEHILGDEGELSPISSTGWNIYSSYPKSDWENTDEHGLRTGLLKQIDRDTRSSILKAIPLQRTVFCLLHGLARVTEKLLNLEIQRVFATANIACQQMGIDSGTYIKETIQNLEQNINSRGVRQGNFHVVMKGNVPEDIKLNKTHAEAILSDVPVGMEAQFPHVLTGVVPTTFVRNTLPANVNETLGFPETFTEFELVVKIWKHFYTMHKIISHDSKPKLRDGCLKGSKRTVDYSWGYTEEDISRYSVEAEKFYQLFKLRYTCAGMTPYMMKYVDYGNLLMKSIPFPVGRMQSEGGEHANYLHNCYYYQHTTRHGGGYRLDPILAILNNMWKRICFHITSDTSVEGKKACANFLMYKKRHLAAVMIQRNYRLYRLKKRKRMVQTEEAPTSGAGGIFTGKLFVLSGVIPVIDGRRFTRQEFTNMIKECGGRVRNKLSSKNSTKCYIVLSGPIANRIPAIARACERNGHHLLHYSYVTESIQKGCAMEMGNYAIRFPGKSNIPKAQSLQAKHFRKKKRMIAIIKKARKTLLSSPKTQKIPRVAKNVAVYYAQTRRRALTSRRHLTFKESTDIYCEMLKTWANLPAKQKGAVVNEYMACLKEKSQREKSLKEGEKNLQKRNTIFEPAYAKVCSFENLQH